MSEADLFQEYYNSISLAYTAGQWWITVSTALVVATYFAARHIPHWLFGVIILLYLMSATSSIIEGVWYASMAGVYGARLRQVWMTNNIPPPIGNSVSGAINTTANIGVFILGTIAAISFSFVTWRHSRTA